MFVDASAFVAILTEEAGFESLAATIESRQDCITSPIALWETVIRLSQKKSLAIVVAQQELSHFCRAAKIVQVPIDAAVALFSFEAYDRFGKRRHPAALNMGDCFAYACAKAHKVPLLYVGDDFALTDVNDGFDIA